MFSWNKSDLMGTPFADKPMWALWMVRWFCANISFFTRTVTRPRSHDGKKQSRQEWSFCSWGHLCEHWVPDLNRHFGALGTLLILRAAEVMQTNEVLGGQMPCVWVARLGSSAPARSPVDCGRCVQWVTRMNLVSWFVCIKDCLVSSAVSFQGLLLQSKHTCSVLYSLSMSLYIRRTLHYSTAQSSTLH